MSMYDEYDEFEYCQNNRNDDYHESVKFIEEGFSIDLISESLIEMGLILDAHPAFTGSMEKLVYLKGDSNEVYSGEEIRFIEQISDIYVYSEIKKSIRNGTVPCRVLVVSLPVEGDDSIRYCLSVEKIVNKALDGFNIYFFQATDAIYLGCRLFEGTGIKDCAISKPIISQEEFDTYSDEILSCVDDGFATFYSRFVSAIRPTESMGPGYEELIIKKRGPQNTYLNYLSEIETELGCNLNEERERYMSQFDDDVEDGFLALLNEVEESLAFIKSNRVNTYEMLFDADEMMQMAIETERIHNENIGKIEANNTYDIQEDEEAKSLLGDAEEMIRFLKERRGIQ